MAAPNLRTPVYTPFSSYLVMKDLSEVCSLSGRGMSLKTHPVSASLQGGIRFFQNPYPLVYRLPLRFGFHSHGDNQAYLVWHKYLTSDLGSTHRPMAQHLRQGKRQPLILAAHHFGSGLISAPLACYDLTIL